MKQNITAIRGVTYGYEVNLVVCLWVGALAFGWWLNVQAIKTDRILNTTRTTTARAS